MLLPSPAPVALFWGPEHLLLYNDAYRSVLGAKHPEALGKPGHVVWQEIWDGQLRGLLDGVVRTGEPFAARDLLFTIQRHGFAEETYFDVSYMPVRVESGEVGGVYCIVVETTGRVVGQGRIELLRELAAQNASACTELEACQQAMATLDGRPDVAFALIYANDALLATTRDAPERLAQADPSLVRTLHIPPATPGRPVRMVIGVNAQRASDEQYGAFLDLVADQVGTALKNARLNEAERLRTGALAALDRTKAGFFNELSTQRGGAARAYLAAIVDSADDAIIAKNLDGVVQFCNAAAERLFGYTAQELVGRSVRILIPAERQSEEDEILARLRRGERVEHFETERVTKDGRLINVSLTVSPVRDDSGKIIGASKIGRDITTLKQAEQERERLLRENAAVTETLNSVGAMVASDLDRSKVVQAVTDAATQMTGAEFGAFFYNVLDERGEAYTLYTISGVPREMFSKFPMPRNTQVFEPTFKGTGVLRSDDITRDPRYGHNAPHHGMPAGHLPVRSYLAVPVSGRGGNVIGGLFFGHSEVARFDAVHERIAVGIASWAAVALENAALYESVQGASRIKDEFLASLSHELRTPLNAIVGYVRMLQSGLLAPDRRQKAIDTIERNATSLTQIVEDVLDISRIVSGKIRLNVQTVDLPTVVRNAIDVIAPAADAKRVRVEAVLDPGAGPVSGDPERLQQVLWNLLSNAVKFTPREGRVQVRLERVNSHLELTVSDTGVGIAPEFLPHVFERFRQQDAGSTRERGGLGLGLSIAKQLTEMHGGTIEASSAGSGHGSSFHIKLPLMIVHAPRESAERAHPRSASRPLPLEGGTLEGVHVLIVDDEPDALALATEVLRAVGARMSSAQSVDEALERLAGEVPDVIVTDLGMPHKDGFQLIASIRSHENPKVRQTPAAALTAYARSEDRVRALQAGFQIHLAKPIDPAELVMTVAALAKRVVVKP